MIRLRLVRHGATDWSEAGRFNGTTDVPLNDKGRDQAAGLAQAVGDGPFAGVWTSPLSRCRETAHLVRGDAAVDTRLREFDFGSIEGLTWSDLDPETQAGLVRFEGFAAPNGETVTELYERIDSFLNALGDGEHLVFTHGGLIRALLLRGGRNEEVTPGSVFTLDIGPD